MNLEDLQKPFPECDIEWRIQSAGFSNAGKPWARVLCYVTNRAIQSRLDEVFGPMGWQNIYQPGPSGGVLCGISILNTESKIVYPITGAWITKWDGAENTAIDAVKGGLSGSMKRAAVQWGIGRYLYRMEADFAMCTDQRPTGTDKSNWSQHKDKKTNKNIYWLNPDLPEWALPQQKGE